MASGNSQSCGKMAWEYHRKEEMTIKWELLVAWMTVSKETKILQKEINF